MGLSGGSFRASALKLALLAAQLASSHARLTNDPPACDNSIVEIANQTELDGYKKCTEFTGQMFFIDHEFQGPFDFPGVESVPELSSGYFGPKLKGSDRVDDGVTRVSMPDLTKTTAGAVLFGYLNNLTEVDLPKLERITGDFVIAGSYGVRNLTLPALETITGGVYLDGHFDEINLPSLKSVGYLKLLSTGNISCPDLGAAFASLNFTADDDDFGHGFTCWTGYEENSWNSSEPNGGLGKGSKGKGGDSDSGASSRSSMTLFYGYLAAMALSVLL